MRRADAAFQNKQFTEAASLFEQAEAKDPESLGPSRENWAYCLLNRAVARLNQAGPGDAAALDAASGTAGGEPKLERYRFFNEILVWHANGEEAGIFPAVESVAPLVAEAYERDHRGLDAAYDTMNEAVTANNALETARASAAFKFHLDMHLGKEDAHLYRIVGPDEFDPERGFISIDSPMAKALLRRTEGDEIAVNSPNGRSSFVVTSVHYGIPEKHGAEEQGRKVKPAKGSSSSRQDKARISK